jgi:hypothetical protein
MPGSRNGAIIQQYEIKKGPKTAKCLKPYTALSVPFGRGRRCRASIADLTGLI